MVTPQEVDALVTTYTTGLQAELTAWDTRATALAAPEHGTGHTRLLPGVAEPLEGGGPHCRPPWPRR